MKTFRSQTNPYSTEELINVKRFLIENGFFHISADALDSLSKLVCICADRPAIVMTDEYALLANKRSDGNNYRTKLNYYIKLNYTSVRNKIIESYGFDIGEEFIGVKVFIERISIIYTLYARK